jgi:hypothetical protein
MEALVVQVVEQTRMPLITQAVQERLIRVLQEQMETPAQLEVAVEQEQLG